MSAQRLVSLCPSITETLHALGAWDRVVGRTEYCVHPEGLVDAVPTVGGTKRLKMERLLALEPDLVFANREENRKEDVEALRAAGIPVHLSFPQTVEEAAAVVEDFGRVLGVEEAGTRIAGDIRAAVPDRGDDLAVLYLIWRKPWMAINDDCFIGSVLNAAGMRSVLPPGDTAYPTLDGPELAAAAATADVLLLSSEPFPFEAKHVDEAAEAAGLDAAKVVLVDGQLLSWHGVRTVEGVRYAARLAEDLRALTR